MTARVNPFQTLAGVAVALTIAASVPASAQQLKEISIGLASGSISTGAVRIAKEMGLYDKYGLNPKFTIMDTGSAAVQGMIAGSFQVVVANTGDMIAAQGRGQKVVSITNLYAGLGATLVVNKEAAAKFGVSPTAPAKDRLKALESITIALPSATANFTLSMKAAAQAYGVNLRFTYVGAAAMQAALDSGAVQGYFTSAPFWTGPVLKGTAIVWISGPKGDIPAEFCSVSTSTLLMMRDYADANPEVAKGMANVIADFARAVRERPNDVKAAAGKVFSQLDAATIDLFFTNEASAWEKVKPFTIDEIKHEINFVKQSGIDVPGVDKLDPKALLYP